MGEKEVEKMTTTLADEFRLEGEKRGIEKGIKQGIEKGIEKGKADTVRNALRKMPPKEVASLLDLPLAEVRRLAAKK
jgi:predicted transposase/invertase (TIGR01784 family)